jgi:hypothetical protein
MDVSGRQAAAGKILVTKPRPPERGRYPAAP